MRLFLNTLRVNTNFIVHLCILASFQEQEGPVVLAGTEETARPASGDQQLEDAAAPGAVAVAAAATSAADQSAGGESTDMVVSERPFLSKEFLGRCEMAVPSALEDEI